MSGVLFFGSAWIIAGRFANWLIFVLLGALMLDACHKVPLKPEKMAAGAPSPMPQLG